MPLLKIGGNSEWNVSFKRKLSYSAIYMFYGKSKNNQRNGLAWFKADKSVLPGIPSY